LLNGGGAPTRGLAVVAIGRNEGERLKACLRSLVGRAHPIVYVDSGSTDSSQDFARSLGVEVVDLDMTTKFTAARARNAGLERVLALAPETRYVQFVDGDCEVRDAWLGAGAGKLDADPTLAAVSGRLRERLPEASIYNRLADLEWERPVGEERSCGGNAMLRVEALRKVGGYDASLIAGEEPELCARLRAAGYRIWRLADEMALHDLAMTSREQWLKRARRHGHAMLEVSFFKGPASRGLFAGQIKSTLVWGVAWPVCVAALAMVGVVLLALGAWPAGGAVLGVGAGVFALRWLQKSRMRAQARSKGLDARAAGVYADLLLASKFANVRGMIELLAKRARGRQSTVIDYRDAAKR
jgi:GT2 family glycosyltransferase